MTAQELMEALRQYAPSIAFGVVRTPDELYSWDGDGPDPAEEGYVAYDVDVQAQVVHKGRLVSGHDYLGGSYDDPAHPCPDIHGYLPQLLEGAIDDLTGNVDLPAEILRQAGFAKTLVQAEIAARYAEQIAKAR